MSNGLNPNDGGVWVALGIFVGAYAVTRFGPTKRFLEVTGFRIDRFLIVATAIAALIAILVAAKV